MKDKVFLITGNGFLTKNLVKQLLEESKEIRILSRNEKSQWETRRYFNNNKIKFIIGDVRDYEALYGALEEVDYCIHTGAIKRIDVAEKQPMEAIKTNVIGSMNVINACVNRNIKKLVLISTDKATNASTCYGATKFLMECMANANETNTEIIKVRYGNVFGSTGSVVPIFLDLKSQNKPLTITNPNMTRFFMSVNDAVNLILYAIKNGKNKDLIVYKNKSCTVKELADIISDNQIVNGTEYVEKTDEALLTVNELNHSKLDENYYIVRNEYVNNYDKPLTSENCERLSKEELEEMLDEYLQI